MKLREFTRILIIEDELIIAADIHLQLNQLGYDVIGIHQNAEDAILTIKNSQPDLVLIDVGLRGKDCGIDAAISILNNAPVPILFLAYHINQELFHKMIKTNPYALIPKPFQKIDLERGIQTALKRISFEKKCG